MRRSVAVGLTLTAIFLAGCSGWSQTGQQNNEGGSNSTTAPISVGVAPGYKGGCEKGFTVWTQNQFTATDGGYGTLVRGTLDDGAQPAGLSGNDKLTAAGWFDSGESLYPNNPTGIRGEVWYYIPQLPNGGAGWVSDAGVRAVQTKPAPGNRDSDYNEKTQAAPKPQECKLTH